MATMPLVQNQKNPSPLESYLTKRLFQVKFKDEITTLKKSEVGVPQGSVLGSFLYLMYTRELPTSDNTIAISADYTAILASHEEPATA
jgi:hypothetical protein